MNKPRNVSTHREPIFERAQKMSKINKYLSNITWQVKSEKEIKNRATGTEKR